MNSKTIYSYIHTPNLYRNLYLEQSNYTFLHVFQVSDINLSTSTQLMQFSNHQHLYNVTGRMEKAKYQTENTLYEKIGLQGKPT